MNCLSCLVFLILVVVSNTATTTSASTSTSTSTSRTTTTVESTTTSEYVKLTRTLVSLVAQAIKHLSKAVKPIFENLNESFNGFLQYLSDVDNMILPDYDHLLSFQQSIMTLFTTIPLIYLDIKEDSQKINKTEIIEAMQRVLGRILENRFAKYN